MTIHSPRTVIVIPVIGGSIELFRNLLSSLPSMLTVPLLVPVRGEAALLERVYEEITAVTDREVVALTSGAVSLPERGVILVPAGQALALDGDEIGIADPGENDNSRSAAPAVESIASTLGERVLGVIVDGAAIGVVDDVYAIHDHGGTVIVAGSTGHDGLPATIPPSRVDVVAPLDEIGSVIVNLLRSGSPTSARETSDSLRALLDDLRDRFGINFSAYKQPTIIRRIQRRMADTGQETLAAYHAYLDSHPQEYRRLVSSFLIKVTSFFRDPELYDYLEQHILPDLIEYAQLHDGELRVWSAGCATGEEAYSLAILLSEALHGKADSVRARIFATDLDAGAIEFARRGVYPGTALNSLPQELVDRYFVQIDGEFQVAKRIRAMCIFGQHDLAERAPFPRIDLLVSRNVLIYFTGELQRRVLQLFAFSLRDNGYLVLGKSETTTPLPEYFVADNARLKVCRRRGERMVIPSSGIRRAMTPDMQVRHPPRTSPAQEVVHPAEGNRSRLREQRDGTLMHLPVGVIHVNEQYDIQFINNAARRLLHIHGNALGEDLVHLAQDLPSREFRRAIDLAFSDGRTTTLEDIPATEPATGEHQYLRISVLPQPDNHYETVVQVLVQDVTDAVTRQHALQEMLDRERAETASLRDQVQRLSETNGSLLAANQELTVINLELRATNEEYLVGNEELQAAAEEVETLNEELQATNEELETLNEELQATVEELRATNEDLQSRSVELEELAVSLQAQRTEIDIERARLEVILSSMADAVIVVDRSGRTLLTNTAYQSMFPGSFQPLDANGQPLRQEALPWMAAARGEDCEMEFMVQEWDGRRRWFEARGRPIDGSLGAQGGMAVIRDITDRSIHRLQEEFLSTASHELRGPLTALNGFLSMAQRALGSQVDMDKLRSYLERARHQTDRLQILVRDLVDVTRLQKGTIRLEMGPVDALEVARQAIDTAQQLASEPPITPNLPGEPVMVQGDATRLEQVLLNLLTNAQTYAPESEAIELAIASSDGEAAITVCDQGSGIPEGDLPHLFTRFYTGTNESAAGLGLGLYISQELVDAMNGTISVESGEGKGTTFTVRLPLADV